MRQISRLSVIAVSTALLITLSSCSSTQSTLEADLLGQSHYVNDGHKNGMNTRLLWILLHIILHISTFNHSS